VLHDDDDDFLEHDGGEKLVPELAHQVEMGVLSFQEYGHF
jgi:hypothetical protein